MFLLVEQAGQLAKFPELFWLPVAITDKCVHKGFVPTRTPIQLSHCTHNTRAELALSFTSSVELVNFFATMVSKLQNSRQLSSFCAEIGVRYALSQVPHI
jgi:hypothetical protein